MLHHFQVLGRIRRGGKHHKHHHHKKSHHLKRGKGFADFWRTLNNPNDWGRAIANEVTNSESDLRRKVIPAAKQVVDVVKSLYGGRRKHKTHHKRRHHKRR